VTVLLVALGAAVGAPTRYLTDRAVQARLGTAFPWGTFTVNVAGCFILGALTGTVPTHVLALVGTGFCGALTTYSTFSWEAYKLPPVRSVGYVVASTAVGLGAAALGWWLF
jgi:fluoride exporter